MKPWRFLGNPRAIMEGLVRWEHQRTKGFCSQPRFMDISGDEYQWLAVAELFFEAFCDGGIEVQVAFGLRNNHMPNWGCIHRPNLGGFTDWFGSRNRWQWRIHRHFTADFHLEMFYRWFRDASVAISCLMHSIDDLPADENSSRAAGCRWWFQGCFAPEQRVLGQLNCSCQTSKLTWTYDLRIALKQTKTWMYDVVFQMMYCRYETTIKFPISTVDSLDQKGKHMHNSVLTQDIFRCSWSLSCVRL